MVESELSQRPSVDSRSTTAGNVMYEEGFHLIAYTYRREKIQSAWEWGGGKVKEKKVLNQAARASNHLLHVLFPVWSFDVQIIYSVYVERKTSRPQICFNGYTPVIRYKGCWF